MGRTDMKGIQWSCRPRRFVSSDKDETLEPSVLRLSKSSKEI